MITASVAVYAPTPIGSGEVREHPTQRDSFVQASPHLMKPKQAFFIVCRLRIGAE